MSSSVIFLPKTGTFHGMAAVAPPACVSVIADEEFDCRALVKLLKEEGLDVFTAACGEQAVEALRGWQFEVAIADLTAPGIDGSQTTSTWRKMNLDVEVIMLTGHDAIDASIAAPRQGARDLAAKPVDAAELHSALNRALGRRRSRSSRADASARAVIETAVEAIAVFDKEGVRDFNPMAEQIFGLSRESAVGKNLADFAIPARPPRVFRKHLETAYREGKDPLEGWAEVPALRQNGEEYSFEISTVAFKTPEGKFLSTFGRDVTGRKRVEEALRGSEAKLQAIFEGVEAGIFLIDP